MLHINLYNIDILTPLCNKIYILYVFFKFCLIYLQMCRIKEIYYGYIQIYAWIVESCWKCNFTIYTKYTKYECKKKYIVVSITLQTKKGKNKKTDL